MSENAEWISNLLYEDVRNLAASFWRRRRRPILHSHAQRYATIKHLLADLRSGKIEPNTLVSIRGRPSIFLPFSRPNAVPPAIGFNSDQRLGPQFITADEHIGVGIMRNMTSFLRPVSYCSPIEDNIYQVHIYEGGDPAVGFSSGIHESLDISMPSIPAVCDSRLLSYIHHHCTLTGVARMLSPTEFSDFPDPVRAWNRYRERGDVFFLDLIDDDSEIINREEKAGSELWGALYSSGHIEIKSGSLPIQSTVENTLEALRARGFSVDAHENSGSAGGIYLLGRGVRCIFEPKAPPQKMQNSFGLHFDVDLCDDHTRTSQCLEEVTNVILDSFASEASRGSAEINNLHDVNFCSAPIGDNWSLLESDAARTAQGPLIQAIRRWHQGNAKRDATLLDVAR